MFLGNDLLYLIVQIAQAKENDLFALAREVSRSLVEIYKQMANSFLKSKDKDAETSALVYLDKCLDVDRPYTSLREWLICNFRRL